MFLPLSSKVVEYSFQNDWLFQNERSRKWIYNPNDSGQWPNVKHLCSGLKNFAIGTQATQSSTHSKRYASNAVDGDRSTNSNNGSTMDSCTHTRATNPWWTVDLNRSVSVQTVCLCFLRLLMPVELHKVKYWKWIYFPTIQILRDCKRLVPQSHSRSSFLNQETDTLQREVTMLCLN